MPRKRKTQPGPGGAYSNRTDLAPATQPVRTPTGLAYGENQALAQAQAQAPLPQVQGAPQGDPALAAAQGHAFSPIQLNAPTQRPFEPVTHGLPMGPGAGSEVLPRRQTTTDQLKKLALSTGDPTIQALANRMEQYGL